MRPPHYADPIILPMRFVPRTAHTHAASQLPAATSATPPQDGAIQYISDTDAIRAALAVLGIGTAHAQARPPPEEELTRRSKEAHDLTPEEEFRLAEYERLTRELRDADPNDPELFSLRNPASVPNQAWIDRLQSALLAARRRSAAAEASARDRAIDAIVSETLHGRAYFQSKIIASEDDVIDAALRFLGPNYRQVDRYGDVFRSADGLRQFRWDKSSLEGRHAPFVSHVSFEVIDPRTGEVTINNHVEVRWLR